MSNGIGFNEVYTPLDDITNTCRVCVTGIELINDKKTNELKAIKLSCGCEKLKNNFFRWNFKVRINTLHSKITEEDVIKSNGIWIDLIDPIVLPYSFLNERKVLIKGTYVIADDFTIVTEEDMEVDIYA
ncbi:hypothetical protein J2Z53_001707 [Clostridium moniliforme]|uniref:Uncharacterized protein n=1 Tax=Clostridium moniliforme TaxID=39489 RepID=A0ABS4F1J3_9CLOT|nr:hypothetical protein [Clostridium moniliforme]MBP1890123.1 hypothetical protein [Clostridium moniliforme]